MKPTRLPTVAILTFAIVPWLPAAVGATGPTVTDVMVEAASAEYRGTGIVSCGWGRDSAAASYEVVRSGGMSMVTGPNGAAVLVQGGVTAMRSGAGWYGTRVEEWASWSVSDRYTVAEGGGTSRLGRAATALTVLEAGRPRIRMVVDDESGVPLLTEILDGDGAVFRTASLVAFTPGSHDMPEAMPDMPGATSARPTSAPTFLPRSVAGYHRADLYSAGAGMIHGFYTDGLFSFSVFEARLGGRPRAFETSTEFRSGDRTYRRTLTPTSIWVHWNAPDRTYVLVGDLPPDHLLAVLEALPAPGERSLLIRLWRRLFG